MNKIYILVFSILLISLVSASFPCNIVCNSANLPILNQVWNDRLQGDYCDCSTNSPIDLWQVELSCFDLNGRNCWDNVQSQACITGCAYKNCQPNWTNRQEGSCQTNDQKLINYTDANSCNKNENLPADAGWQSCNYCISDMQGPFYTDWSECSINLTTNRVRYYTDSDYNSCCALTGLSSDCEINNFTYSNFTESSTCEYSLIITLTSAPFEGDSDYYSNLPEEIASDELTFQYNLTNSSEIDRCFLLIDNKIIATSKDSNNVNDFYTWNDEEYSNELIEDNFTEGNHNWKVFCNSTSGVSNYSETRTFYVKDYNTAAPIIYLTWPNENQIFNLNEEISLEIPEIYSFSEVKNCSQIVDGQIRWIWNFTDWIQVGDIYYTDSGKHSWSYNCTNMYGTGYSENRTFYRLNGDIISENLSLTYNNASNDLSNISGLYIFSWVGSESRFQGIYFIENINLSTTNNLSDFISISNYRIFVDSVKAPWLNKNATLIFEDVTFANPRILKDGAVISIPFSYINGTLTFNVTGFSEYVIEETPVSPPSSSSSSSSSGGGGGGGGGSSKKTIVQNATIQSNETVVLNNETTVSEENNKSVTEEQTTTPTGGTEITGAVIGSGVKKGIFIVVGFILAIGIILFIVRKIKKRKSS